MSSPTEVIREIEARGLRISAAGSELRLRGPRERMDPALIATIKTHKAELIAHLSTPGAERPAAGFPLTPLQQSYLLGRGGDFELGNVANHAYAEVEGVWDIDRLAAALRSVVRRHGMLRTRFVDGTQIEQPWPIDVRIQRLDLRDRTPAEQRADRLRLRHERSHRILPADRAPLLAVGVTILADDRMVLHIGLDGLVADGMSFLLFYRDWWRAYRDGPENLPDTAELPFAEFVAALRDAATRAPARRSRGYWLDRIDDLAPHPNLPLAKDPAAITHPRFVPRAVRLDLTAWAAFKAQAHRAGLTPATALLAAYAETLSVWGAGRRFTVTTTVAHRLPIHPRIADAIGNFSDTMLVDIAVDRGISFADRATALQDRMHRDLDHRHFSGIEVMRELARRRADPTAARMPFTFNCTIGNTPDGLDGSCLELFGPEVYSVSQTPQVWVNVFAAERPDGLLVKIDAVDELFPAGLVEDLVAGYRAMLNLLCHAENWAARDFDLLPAGQRARRVAANDTATPVAGAMLADAFVAAAERTPDAAAIITGHRTMSYGELLRRARQVAAWLRSGRVARDELVGLVMTRGPEQIVGMLGTLLAGAAYLPVDADLPAARREFLLRDGKVRYALTNTDWTGETFSVLRLDCGGPVPDGDPADLEPLPGAGPNDLAYVLYTSGTTGEPKGVMVSHRSAVNVIADCTARFAVTSADRFFGISAFTFDLSVYDVFGALSAGAAIVLPDADRAADAAHWVRLCGAAGVTVWNSVPAIATLLHEAAAADGPERLATLRLIMLSGDRIPPALPAALRALNPDLELVSLGGPTETTIWNILHPIAPGDEHRGTIPYGRPNANNRAYVLDQDGLDTPDWVAGEICAAGTGLARGYWADEARTAEKFPFDERRGERLYRTGDIGRYLPDGEIEILGRADHQLKVNGYRVEAGEIEAQLARLAAVRQAVVVRQERAGGDRLVAHLVPDNGERPADGRLRELLGAVLPAYLVPATFVWHARLPLTRNGKVDRGALAARAAPDRPAAAPVGGPVSETAHRVARLWAAVLRTDRVDPDENFFELGGNSIDAARIVTRVRKEFGVSIPLQRLTELVTARAMAGYVDAERPERDR
ncbi:MAG TPA: amino acid adenylation domain-containing protein [Actinophytocola sp.]|uniref:non-ribosomal peptide synthetase n=1 Tax=Actinophytocola sp. TaxID=1872138 RepID=UPI002DB74A0A|nr:amino acid adenylation domain-containing protein [Actinophytocola sp.]HEU5470232.1 amino acid adenylation domain-containing protein [Actinophytocola sp.]